MINTVFYFVKDFATYQDYLDRGEISAKTIVFVEDLKAIYKNGVRYGSMSDVDLSNKINTLYDDTATKEWLNRIDQTIIHEQTRLTEVITELDQDIQNKVTDMFEDAQWVKDNVVQNQTIAESNFGEEDVERYLQRIGMWTVDSNGNTVIQWSKILLDISSIISQVNGLREYTDGKYDALQSSITQSVDMDINEVRTDIENFYARLNEAKSVIEWMYSGLKSSASPEKSIAEIIAAGKSGLLSAISDMRTYVEKLENGDYVATSSLTSQINQRVGDIEVPISSAGIINNVTLDDALSVVYASLTDPKNSNFTGISEMATSVESLENGNLISRSTLLSEIRDIKGDVATVLTSAGLINEATLNSAKTELRAEMSGANSDTLASLTQRVGTLEGAGYISESNLVNKIVDNKTNIITQAGLATSAQIDGLGTTYLAKADLVSQIIANKTDIISQAGLQTSAGLDSAVATLIAQNGSSSKAAVQAIANGTTSTVTVYADDIVMDANHLLSLDADTVSVSSNFYDLVSDNISIQASDLGITANDITIDANNKLNLTAANVNIDSTFIDASTSTTKVNNLITNSLESGTGTFKGDVQATTFTAGGAGEAGIVVMSGSFDPNGADTSKLYFAYDPSQSAPNLYIYDSTALAWRQLNFSAALKSADDYYPSTGWYSYKSGQYVKKTDTTLSASDFTPVTLYIANDTGRYWTSSDISNNALVTGYYYRKPYYSEINDATLGFVTTYQFLGYLGLNPGDGTTNNTGGLGPALYAEINYNSLDSSVHNNLNSATINLNNRYVDSPIDIQSGITNSTTADDCASTVYYSNNAVLSYSVDSTTGIISNVQRGFAFLGAKTYDPLTDVDDRSYYWNSNHYKDYDCLVITTEGRIEGYAYTGTNTSVLYNGCSIVSTAGDCNSRIAAAGFDGNYSSTFLNSIS